MQVDRFEQACDWRDKHRQGPLPRREYEAFIRWLAADPRNRAELERLNALGQELRRLPRPDLASFSSLRRNRSSSIRTKSFRALR